MSSSMKIGLYSIPGTGTRFVSEFLTSRGILHFSSHAGGIIKTDLLVCPVRNPYDCYLTHQHKQPAETDVEFVSLWGRYIYETARRDCFYFPLDTPDRFKTLKCLLRYCEVDTSLDTFDWGLVCASNRDHSLQVPEYMIAALKFAHDWYLEKTLNTEEI